MSMKNEIFELQRELAEELESPRLNRFEDELYQLRSQVKRYEALISLGKLLSTSLDFENIQKKAINKIRELLGAEHLVLYIADEFGKELVGRRNDSSEKASLAIDELTFAGTCAHYRAILHIHDARNDMRMAREKRVHSDINFRTILLAPLVQKGEVLGVIEAINSKSQGGDFDKEDLYFIEAVANKLTSTIESVRLFNRLQRQFYQVCESMGDVILKRDRYTGGHTKRVAYFSEMIGREMGMSSDELKDLKLSAILHDIGKVGIDDTILKKQGHLTQEEFEIMKTHPRLGDEIVGKIEGLKGIVDGVRFHHERPDGKGYPYGLKGDDIPVVAQIISVADTFDAMVSNRPYRKGLDPFIAYQEIKDNCGTQFGEKVVLAFERAFLKSLMYKRSRPALKEVA